MIGLLSGLTGTGGGIFLSPLLIFTRWAETRDTGGVSAAFILVNSAAWPRRQSDQHAFFTAGYTTLARRGPHWRLCWNRVGYAAHRDCDIPPTACAGSFYCRRKTSSDTLTARVLGYEDEVVVGFASPYPVR